MFIFTLLFMSKDKYLLIFLAFIAILLLWKFFPISYDNNDDQAMLAISAGIFSNIKSPNIILTNLFFGKFINILFYYNKNINWYTLYLQVVHLLCFIGIASIIINNNKISTLNSIGIIFIIFFGFISLSIVKLQFTTVALLCCFTALFYLQSDLKTSLKSLIILVFVAISILIRKDSFYVFILFCIPVFILRIKNRKEIVRIVPLLMMAVSIFFVCVFFNNNDSVYKEQQTYTHVNALDIIAGKPIKINNVIIQKNNFSKNDIALIQSWFMADDTYLKDGRLEQIAIQLKTNRNFSEIQQELKKFVQDERYLLLLYLISLLLVLFFNRKSFSKVFLNFLVFIFVLIYLTITSRIPHRVTFPILTYLILLNVWLFFEKAEQRKIKSVVMVLLVSLSIYKFYCTSKLIHIHHENHQVFDAYKNEINAHPNNLFIALDDFPMQFMNAWQSPNNIFPAHNIIPTGWYSCSPDYQVLLKLHHIKNLTSDIKNRNEVLFLTQNETLQSAYINVMKERYNIACHFEKAQDGFSFLHPKKLVIDN